ncbi:hypothetical protein Tco_1404423 [Tanacetum coccineum]
MSTSSFHPSSLTDVAGTPKDMVRALIQGLDKKPNPSFRPRKALNKVVPLWANINQANSGYRPHDGSNQIRRSCFYFPVLETLTGNTVYQTQRNDLKSDFLLFEEADSFLALEDDPTSSEVDPTYQDPEGDILILEAILNSEPPPPLPNHEQYMPEVRKELKLCEAKTVEPSIDEPPEVELKELPPHLEYAFLEGDNKLPVIIAKDLKDEEKAALLKVLKSHKRAIAWKLSDIKGVSPEFCTHKILMEEDYEHLCKSEKG